MKAGLKAKAAMIYVAAGVASVLGGGSEAHAWLKICNQTNKTVSYENTINDSGCTATWGGPWRDAGWWNMAPGECKTVSSLNMTNRYFYFFAQATDNSLVWTSASFGWKVSTSAHNECRGTGIGCTNNGHNPPHDLCFGEVWNQHREVKGTATNYTLNLN